MSSSNFVSSILWGAPNEKICPCARGPSADNRLLFRNLLDGVAVLVHEDREEGLADEFFWRLDKPLASDM